MFQEAIRRDYPLLKPQDELAVVMAGSNLVHQQGTRIWRFEDVEQRWVAVLSDDFLAIETRHYDRFEELRDRFRTLVAAFRQIYSPVLTSRIGLRFIDEIRTGQSQPPNWGGVIRTEFLGPLTIGRIAAKTSQALQELHLRFERGEALVMRHGSLPDATTVQPQPGEVVPSGPFYLLDFDASRTFEQSDIVAFDEEVIIEHVDRYHDAIYQLFRATITLEYADHLANGGAS